MNNQGSILEYIRRISQDIRIGAGMNTTKCYCTPGSLNFQSEAYMARSCLINMYTPPRRIPRLPTREAAIKRYEACRHSSCTDDDG